MGVTSQRGSGRAGERKQTQNTRGNRKEAQLALAAHALAVSRGRTYATLGDYRECNGVPRQVSSSQKNVPNNED